MLHRGNSIMAIPALWQSEFVLNQNPSLRQDMSRVVALKNGAFFAVWTQEDVSDGSLIR
jgi:hypothetical protein